MRRALFSIFLLAIACPLIAQEPDEMEITLMKRAEWFHLKGEELFAKGEEKIMKRSDMYCSLMDFAFECFKLERQYLKDLNNYRMRKNQAEQ